MKKGIICAVLALMVVLSMAGVAAATTTISFNPNGGTGGPSSFDLNFGDPMPPISDSLPTKTNFNFTGYFDKMSGGKQYYNGNGTSAMAWDKEDATATLYAHWTSVGQNTEVKLDVGESYEWSAPADLTVGVTESGAIAANIGVTTLIIDPGKKLQISTGDTFTGQLTHTDGSAKLDYTLQVDSTPYTKDSPKPIKIDFTESNTSKPLKAYIASAAETAGTWTETLTFTAEIVDS